LTDEKPVAALFNQQQVAEVARNKTACIQQWFSWTLQEMTVHFENVCRLGLFILKFYFMIAS
jgi:hypothetical protein